MQEFYSIRMDKGSKVPLYLQLGNGLCNLIEKGILAPNSKLPPIRKMAEALKINRVTVVTAYKYLENKKAVYSQMGSGTYVSPIPLLEIPEPVVEKTMETEELKYKSPIDNAINFVSTSLPETLFPVEEFKRAFDEILDSEQGKAFQNQISQGYLPLREALVQYLFSYGIKTNAEQIQIISGAQQGIDIAAKALIGYGDIVFVEKPTFYGAAGAFLSRGARLMEIPLQEDGMDLEQLENLMKLYRPRLLYMMAYFQTPTGISYSLEKKRKLLELAEQYDTYLIEDDNLYDFNYTREPIIPLKALDYRNRVIYIKSFSKILMPGLRIGLIILPKKIMQSVIEVKYWTDIATSGLIQKAFYTYLTESDWKSHVEVMRQYGMEKYRRMIREVDQALSPYVTYKKPQGGISLWLTLLVEIPIEELSNRLLLQRVIISPGSQYFYSGEDSRQIRLCFANVSDDKIAVGCKRIGKAIRELLEEKGG